MTILWHRFHKDWSLRLDFQVLQIHLLLPILILHILHLLSLQYQPYHFLRELLHPLLLLNHKHQSWYLQYCYQHNKKVHNKNLQQRQLHRNKKVSDWERVLMRCRGSNNIAICWWKHFNGWYNFSMVQLLIIFQEEKRFLEHGLDDSSSHPNKESKFNESSELPHSVTLQ